MRPRHVRDGLPGRCRTRPLPRLRHEPPMHCGASLPTDCNRCSRCQPSSGAAEPSRRARATPPPEVEAYTPSGRGAAAAARSPCRAQRAGHDRARREHAVPALRHREPARDRLLPELRPASDRGRRARHRRAARRARRDAGLPALRHAQPRRSGLLPELRRQPAAAGEPGADRGSLRGSSAASRARHPRAGCAADRCGRHRHRLAAAVRASALRRSTTAPSAIRAATASPSGPHTTASPAWRPGLLRLRCARADPGGAAGGAGHRRHGPRASRRSLQLIGLLAARSGRSGLVALFVVVEVVRRCRRRPDADAGRR